MGIKIKPTPRWALNAYFDQFFFPNNRFRVGFPSRGYEVLTQVDFKPRRGTLIYVRFRSDNQQRNARTLFENEFLQTPVDTRRNQLRFQYQSQVNPFLLVRTRAEFSWFNQAREQEQRGILVYQDISWKQGFKLKLTARYALFDIDGSDARIYAYENDILGFFSIPPYNGVGTRYYAILNYKATRRLEFWVRFAQTRLFRTRSIGSGLNRIEGDTQSELKMQVRVKF